MVNFATLLMWYVFEGIGKLGLQIDVVVERWFGPWMPSLCTGEVWDSKRLIRGLIQPSPRFFYT